jgi:hypothetical protein
LYGEKMMITSLLEAGEHDGRPWNRAIIRNLLRCEPLSLRTVRIRFFCDDGPEVHVTGGEATDVAVQPWKPATAAGDKPVMSEDRALNQERITEGGLSG